MRKWFGRIHGGQLVMLLVPLCLVGFVPMWFGYTFALLPSNATYIRASKYTWPSDSALHASLMAEGQAQASLALRFIGSGLAIWCLAIPMIWWWLAARQRKILS